VAGFTPSWPTPTSNRLYSLSRSWADLVARSRTQNSSSQPSTSTGTLSPFSNLALWHVDRFDAILPAGAPRRILAVGGSRPCVVCGQPTLHSVKRQTAG